MIIGIAGPIGAGKSTVASLLPAEAHIQWADPLYAGLATMLGVQEDALRDRQAKEEAISWLGSSPRHLLQTLGTDWGRDLIRRDLWVLLTMRRIKQHGWRNVAICGTRFPNEVTAIRATGGEIWWVTRDTSATTTHRSEGLIGPEDCDRVIDNTGSLADLWYLVRDLWDAATR